MFDNIYYMFDNIYYSCPPLKKKEKDNVQTINHLSHELPAIFHSSEYAE